MSRATARTSGSSSTMRLVSPAALPRSAPPGALRRVLGACPSNAKRVHSTTWASHFGIILATAAAASAHKMGSLWGGHPTFSRRHDFSDRLLGSRQSPTPWPVETHPEPGRLPSPPVLLSDRSQRYYAPLRHPPPSPPIRGGEGRTPSRRWASRVAPCSVPTCHAPYPGERSRGHRSVTPA